MSGRLPGGVTSRLSTRAFAAGVSRREAICETSMWPLSCHASALACRENKRRAAGRILLAGSIRFLLVDRLGGCSPFLKPGARLLNHSDAENTEGVQRARPYRTASVSERVRASTWT